MQENYFDSSFDAYEVFNQFPVLKESLERFGYNFEDILEGETLEVFLSRQDLSSEEVQLLLRRFNGELKRYLKKEGIEESETKAEEILESSVEEITHTEEE